MGLMEVNTKGSMRGKCAGIPVDGARVDDGVCPDWWCGGAEKHHRSTGGYLGRFGKRWVELRVC